MVLLDEDLGRKRTRRKTRIGRPTGRQRNTTGWQQIRTTATTGRLCHMPVVNKTEKKENNCIVEFSDVEMEETRMIIQRRMMIQRRDLRIWSVIR